jgi:hypothetical protein
MRTAACRCGALTATCEGEPVRISACHCLACQRRTGSAFSAQARFPAEKVRLEGAATTFVRTADSGNQITYRFCPTCGSTVAYEGELYPGLIAIPLGAFADPAFPPPRFSVWESRRHAWTGVAGEEVEHTD